MISQKSGYSILQNTHLTRLRAVITLNSQGGMLMWLPLAEYSMKHNVSISTLRRRIKNEDISYKLDNGKYLIFDETLEDVIFDKKIDNRSSLKSDNSKSSLVSERIASSYELLEKHELNADWTSLAPFANVSISCTTASLPFEIS